MNRPYVYIVFRSDAYIRQTSEIIQIIYEEHTICICEYVADLVQVSLPPNIILLMI